MKFMPMADRVRYRTMTTSERRDTFLVDRLFTPGEVQLAYTDLDRAVIGSAVPLATPLTLPIPPELRAAFFCERREVGVLNIGGPGHVTVDATSFDLAKLDCLYIGREAQHVSFSSTDPAHPAAFYLLSYPAHAAHPTALAPFSTLIGLRLGAAETCNQRTIYKAIYKDGLQSCQLVMGFTLLDLGSNWNTMPPHTHMRRSEVYLYFDLDPAHRILHLMGPPGETSHLVVADREAVLSPGWSIHAGVGTRNYAFCWGMGGENQAYDDMDPAAITELQ